MARTTVHHQCPLLNIARTTTWLSLFIYWLVFIVISIVSNTVPQPPILQHPSQYRT